MSFKLSTDHTFWLKVVFSQPEDNGPTSSRLVERAFSVRIRAVGGGDKDASPNYSLIQGWDGIHDAEGQPVAYSAEGVTALLAHPFAGPALREAWAAALPHH